MYGDWKEVFNQEKGKPFYKNTATGESTWKVPAEVQAMKDSNNGGVGGGAGSPPPPAAAASNAGANSRVKDGWKEVFDPTKGKHYYVNLETKERTWNVEKTPFSA